MLKTKVYWYWFFQFLVNPNMMLFAKELGHEAEKVAENMWRGGILVLLIALSIVVYVIAT